MARRPARALRLGLAFMLPVALLAVAASVLFVATSAPPREVTPAANTSVSQCNDVGPGPGGATTMMTCTVTVVNTVSNGATSSTVTMTRQCSLDPCPPGNGTFTSSSADLVTSVEQCNGSGNDAAHPINCTVTITNNVSADTPGALPVTPVTVNQCVGSGAGGGGTVNCLPFPATTTSATVTQCNGSSNGGGATVACTVGAGSTVSSAIPVRVNQCNGTGNPGGSVVTCGTTITTNIVAATASASPGTPVTPATGVPPTSAPAADMPPIAVPATGVVTAGVPLSATPSRRPVSGRPQVRRIPSGAVQAGGGSTAAATHPVPLMPGGALVLAAVLGVLGVLYYRRARRDRTG